MEKLIWEKEDPKKHGFYWVCEDGFLYDPRRYEILLMYPEIEGRKAVNRKDHWYDNYWFAGPIPEPENPITKQ